MVWTPKVVLAQMFGGLSPRTTFSKSWEVEALGAERSLKVESTLAAWTILS